MNITIQTWLEESKQTYTRKRLQETIRNNLVPINKLSPDRKKMVLSQAKILVYQMGTYLFKKGDNDNFIYYLLEGKVELKAVDKASIAVYGGTDRAMNPLSGKCPREYSARAASVVKVLMVERHLLASVLPAVNYN